MAEGWSRDVSDDVANALRERCAERGEVPAFLAEFLERYDTGRSVQLPLPITETAGESCNPNFC